MNSLSTESLQEVADARGLTLRVDRHEGRIRGVKILGLRSRNGRRYLPLALAEAVGLYEGAKVHVNHPSGPPAAVRDYRDRLGVIRHVRLRPDEGLFGDLYFNPKHALAEQLVWDAEHASENVGFSHNVEAHTTRRGEETLVDRIVRVHSVDLVSSPATTRGLFEAEAPASVAGTTPVQPVIAESADPATAPSTSAEPLSEIHEPRAAESAVGLSPAVTPRQLLEWLADRGLLASERPATDSGPRRSWCQESFLRLVDQAHSPALLEALLDERVQLLEMLDAQQAIARSLVTAAPRAIEQRLAEGPPPTLDPAAFARSILR